MDKVRLTQVVSNFRSALKKTVDDGFHFQVSISPRFPCASCGASSLLLASYLEDQGFSGALRIHGEFGGDYQELRTHVWLQLGETLIDITGSQFVGYNQPEILIAENSDFLEKFEINDKVGIADFRVRYKCGDVLRGYHSAAYRAVLERLNG